MENLVRRRKMYEPKSMRCFIFYLMHPLCEEFFCVWQIEEEEGLQSQIREQRQRDREK